MYLGKVLGNYFAFRKLYTSDMQKKLSLFLKTNSF